MCDHLSWNYLVCDLNVWPRKQISKDRLCYVYKALFLCYVCCQPCVLRVSKSLIPVVSRDFLSLNLKGLKALKLFAIILKVYRAWFVLTFSIKHKPRCFPRRQHKFVYIEKVLLKHDVNQSEGKWMFAFIKQLCYFLQMLSNAHCVHSAFVW